MIHARARLVVRLLLGVALLAAPHAHASETTVADFGRTVAATWEGLELPCPASSYDWFGATPETLYCFRVEMSGLEIRARLNAALAERGAWLMPWHQETPDLVSRPFWAGEDLFRIVVGTSLGAPRLAVVFIRHSLLDRPD